ncbi:MAG: uracil phosphoribosyltransferase [Spirochaetes bacterium]|nr:uracil phosphoribosyltransferase [Spirochaetota bacterium]
MGKLVILDHPVVQNKISMLRNVNTCCKEFREIAGEVASILCYEATRDVPLITAEIETPICKATVNIVTEKFGVVLILRAGMGMTGGMLNFLPNAKVGHIGVYRDPNTLRPVEYFWKLPSDSQERTILLVDPMLATGGTASASITHIKDKGVKHIKFICLISCPEGVEKLQNDHPDVDIYTAAHDPMLNDHGYIVPGLGDAGDRMFGTK